MLKFMYVTYRFEEQEFEKKNNYFVSLLSFIHKWSAIGTSTAALHIVYTTELYNVPTVPTISL